MSRNALMKLQEEVAQAMADDVQKLLAILAPNDVAIRLKHPAVEKAMMQREIPYKLVMALVVTHDRWKALS